MMPSTFLRARATIFLVTNAFAAITLGFAVNLLFEGTFNPRYTASALPVALFHLVSITTMALVSRVFLEVAWLSLLCAMWFAIGMVLRDTFSYRFSLFIPLQAIAAFCYIDMVLLLGYIIALVVVAIRAGKAGRSIWKSNVKEIQQVQGPAAHQRRNINPSNATVVISPPNAAVIIYPLVNHPNYNVPPAMVPFQPYQQQHGWSQPQPHPPPPFYPSVSHPVVLNA